MPNHCKILDAARKVFGEFGFRGATTRRIAQAAGVNEVTLFRKFGSKAALIAEALNVQPAAGAIPSLPDVPDDVEREITLWCRGQLTYLRAASPVIRKTMSEVDERPELTPCAAEGPTRASQQLSAYVTRLRKQGRVAAEFPTPAAVALLMGALFADAMGREMWPHVFPQPAEAAPRMYARLFLRAIGADESRVATPMPRVKHAARRKAAR